MPQASRRFTEGFFLRLSPGPRVPCRAIHIHQRFPGEVFSLPVVSNTLPPDLFRVFPAPPPAPRLSLYSSRSSEIVEPPAKNGRHLLFQHLLSQDRSFHRAAAPAFSFVAATSMPTTFAAFADRPRAKHANSARTTRLLGERPSSIRAGLLLRIL